MQFNEKSKSIEKKKSNRSSMELFSCVSENVHALGVWYVANYTMV